MSLFFFNTLNGRTPTRFAAIFILRLIVILISTLSLGAAGSLSLASGTASADGTVALNLSVTAPSGEASSSLQWTLTHDPSKVSALSLSAGPAATAAGKTLACYGTAGQTKCVLYGSNTSTIANGTAAVLTATVVPGLSSTAIGVSGTVGSSPAGTELLMTGSGGTIGGVVIAPTTLSGLVCAPSTLGTPGVAACTATLSGAAPAGGASIALSSNMAALTVPVSALVPSGAAVVAFSATAGVSSVDQSAVITATYGGVSRTATVSLMASPFISTLQCSPASLASGGISTCSVALTKPAPAGGALVTLADNSTLLTVPASVSITAGAASATFAATAGSIPSSVTATVTATYNGSSKTSSIALAPTISLLSLACSPSALSSGGSATCTATLSGAAPTGGALVTLSANSTLLTVPASVSITAGAASATFAATAGSISSSVTATVTATYNGSSKTSSIALAPTISLLSLACSPSALSSGGSATCTATLSGAAPAGGALVTLSDNSTQLNVPASVSITAGAASANFTATASAASASGAVASATAPAATATVTASFNGTSANASIQIMPPSPGATCPCSVWDSKPTPALISLYDGKALELGMRFRSKVSGYIVGVRFYKATQNKGTHIARLWTKNGAQLASVTFSGESISGWQQANFSTPVAVAANTTYVISYRSSTGYYSANDDYFTSGVDSGPLRALRNGEDGANGLYRYGTSAFPTKSYRASNYWVDVVFNTTPSMQPTSVPLSGESIEISESPASALSRATTSSAAGRREHSLSCSPESVRPGDSFWCQLKLAHPHMAEEQTFSVESKSPHVYLPATLKARPGERSIRFRGSVSADAGPSVLEVSAGDGNRMASDTVMVLQSPVPVIDLPDTVDALAGEAVGFIVNAKDPTGLAVRMNASDLPAGASFSPDTGRLEWTPSSAQSGRHAIAFTAVNAANAAVTASALVTVGAGQPALENASKVACSPGAIATLRGNWFREDRAEDSDPSASQTELNGTRVLVNGVPARLLAASNRRVDFLCPESIQPGEPLDIRLMDAAGASVTATTTMRAATPTILTSDPAAGPVLSAATQRRAKARDFTEGGEPAQPGDSILIRTTGIGQSILDSHALEVHVGDSLAGLESIEPDQVSPGVFWIRAKLPHSANRADSVPVRLIVRSLAGSIVESNSVDVAIEDPTR